MMILVDRPNPSLGCLGLTVGKPQGWPHRRGLNRGVKDSAPATRRSFSRTHAFHYIEGLLFKQARRLLAQAARKEPLNIKPFVRVADAPGGGAEALPGTVA